MLKNKYKVIGVMSGTSLDGIDLICVSFDFQNTWSFDIHEFETVKYNEDWEGKLKNLVYLSKHDLKKIDDNYTLYLAKIINDFVFKYNIRNIDAICSHGHTALHQPEKGITYQIGNQEILAKLTNLKVVCDFRLQDVEMGGQGAPLVPIGDKLLFYNYDYCLNLGGFANVSAEINGERIAYDICPVNIVLNYYVSDLGFKYDDAGQIASTGLINEALLLKLNKLGYYSSKYPKSLGFEWVNKEIFPLIDSFQIDTKDILRTFVEHASYQISKEIRRKPKGKLLVTGGGVFNLFLIKRIQAQCSTKVVIPINEIIEYKEALIFGLLGVLKLRDEVNCLKSVTGAKADHSSGKIFTT